MTSGESASGHDPEPQGAAGCAENRSPIIGPVSAPRLHIMTWNIRRPVPAALALSADRWTQRAPRLQALLATERPTVLCAQEVVTTQLAVVLAGLGPGYHHVGRGRSAGGGGEACPVFYDSNRLELVEWDQFALSDTPHRAGSTSWGNLIPRVAVAVRLRDRCTGSELLVVNTHLDPFSPRSRLRSARALLDTVAGRGLPAVVAGDLNADASSPAVRELLADGTLHDSWAVARTRRGEQWGTYARYRPPRRGGDRIDWILTTPGLTVTEAAINPDRYAGGWPSDHLPVQAAVSTDHAGHKAHNGMRDETRHKGRGPRT